MSSRRGFQGLYGSMGGDFPEDRGEDEWHRLRREALRRTYLGVLLPVGKLPYGGRAIARRRMCAGA